MFSKAVLFRIIVAFSLIVVPAKAAFCADSSDNSPLFEPGRITLSGAATTLGVFGADAMQPLYGNRDQFFYGDFMGSYATDDSYVLSPGGGYRKVFDNQIWGLYFFGDYGHLDTGQDFWTLSPGIEWMDTHWDAHVNGYFPTTKSKQTGPAAFADTLGNYNFVSFGAGTHNQYDDLLTPNVVMGNGADAEVGYSFAGIKDLRTRVYAGGYYYQPSGDYQFPGDVRTIAGITGGVDVPYSKYVSFSVFNSYDQVNNYTVGMRLSISFGGNTNTMSDDVHDRMDDPVERHIGIIDTGAGAYAQQGLKATDPPLEYSDVYFVSPGGTGNGTYGNPAPLDQATLDTANSQNTGAARFYLEGGTTYNVNTTTAPGGSLGVYNGQDFYGRTANYTAPAASNAQPVVSVDGADGLNGFTVQSGENTFNDLAITAASTNGNTIGISVITSGTATINVVNTNITALNTGLYAENDGAGNLTINATNSSFNGNTNSGDFNIGAYGLYAFNASTGNLNINATNSSFNNITNSGEDNSGAYGLNAANASSGNLTINATNAFFSDNTNSGNGNAAHGLHASNGGTGNLSINAVGSQFNDNTSTGADNNGGAGLFAYGTNFNFNIANSSFNGNTTIGAANGSVYGIFINAGNLNLNVTNSTFNGNINDSQNAADGGFANGLWAQVGGNTGIINITNSQFNGNMALNGNGMNPTQAIGFIAQAAGNASVTVNVTGSEFNGNAATGNNNGGATGLLADNGSSNAMTVDIANSQFNGNTASGDNNGGALGLSAFNETSGNLTVSATQSQFNGNTASGANASAYGFYADNAGVGPLSVTSLSGSTFSDNGTYGIYAIGNPSATTTVNDYDATFSGNPTDEGSGGDVTWQNTSR